MKTFLALLFSFFFFTGSETCFSQVYTRSWINTYGNDSVPYDFTPSRLCVSKSGNVYILSNKDTVGFTNMIALTKYNSQGTIIWERVYANSYGNDADASCVTSDRDENIIIGGSEYVPNNNNDYLLIKYDSSGILKWSFHYNGVGNDNDVVNALLVDSSGNIYITGSGSLTGDPYYNTEALTCKIDSSGNLVWASYYNNSDTISSYDNALFLKMNIAGEIVIGGTINTTYAICKYDTAGNLLWTGTPLPFQMGGMALDDSANCYVFNYMGGQNLPLVKYDSSGIIQWNKSIFYQRGGSLSDILVKENFLYGTGYAILDTAQKNDVLILKYNLNGDTIWTRNFNNTSNLSDVGYKILCDSSDNLIVAGTTIDTGNDYDILALKYDSSGNYQWQYQIHDSIRNDFIVDAELDSVGNLFTAGNLNSYDYHFEVAKVSVGGNLQWIDHRINYQARTDFGDKMIRDDAGNIITAGLSSNKTSGMDAVIIKYDDAGNQLWITRINFAPLNSVRVSQIMCDHTGNIYLCGAVDSTGSPDHYHALTAKLDASGNIIWSSLYIPFFEAVSFAFDSSTNLYVLGNIRLAQYRYDTGLLKYDASGNLLWEKPVADSTTQQGQHIFFDGSESFFISLTAVNIQSQGQNITLMKIDTAGNKKWRRDFDGPASQVDVCEELLLDKDVNPILAGYSDSLNYDIVVVKYDSSGNYLWNYRYAGPGNHWDWPKDAVIDNLNNIYLTGRSDDSNYVSDCITLKIDPSGNQIWGERFDGNGSFPYDVGYAIAVSDSGRVIVTGATIDAATNTKILVLVYDSSGNQIFIDSSFAEDSFLDDNRNDVQCGPDETFYISGSLYSRQSMSDILTVKYADIVLRMDNFQPDANTLTLFPNPFNTNLNLCYSSHQDIDASLGFINSAGNKVSEEKIHLRKGKNQFEIDTSDLSAGLYTVVLSKSEGEFVSQRVISIK